MKRRATRIVSTLMLFLTFVGSLPVEGASLGKAAGRAAARGALKRGVISRQRIGPLHSFRKPARLERFTNKPRTDKARGLRKHSFWIRPHAGRRASAAHVQKKLNIPHRVKRRETFEAKPGTEYHERPIKGGRGHIREVILERPVSGKPIKLRERLAISPRGGGKE